MSETPTIWQEDKLRHDQPGKHEGPYTVVRLGTFHQCQCDPLLLQGERALFVLDTLKQVSVISGFTVIGEHYDLYGREWKEKAVNGWTINVSFAQSGVSADAWHSERTVDFNMHWCDENEPNASYSVSPNAAIEEKFWKYAAVVFEPKVVVLTPRLYRCLRYAG